MTTPSISSYEFIGWRGRLHAATRRLAPLPPRTGIPGHAWVMDSWQTNPEPIITSQSFASEATAHTALEAYRALQSGATFVAVDPTGRSWNVKVSSVVGEPSLTPQATWRLVATWTLQVEAAP